MTTVYGVTFVGARDQIEKQLKDRGDVDPAECWLAASYLAKLVGDLFGLHYAESCSYEVRCSRASVISSPPQRRSSSG